MPRKHGQVGMGRLTRKARKRRGIERGRRRLMRLRGLLPPARKRKGSTRRRRLDLSQFNSPKEDQ